MVGGCRLTCAELLGPRRCEPSGMALQVREEQMRLRPDLEATITGEVLNGMTYLRQVVKEVLRYRPPAPMVPQVWEFLALSADNPNNTSPTCVAACFLGLYQCHSRQS